jgi:hypothetical protein
MFNIVIKRVAVADAVEGKPGGRSDNFAINSASVDPNLRFICAVSGQFIGGRIWHSKRYTRKFRTLRISTGRRRAPAMIRARAIFNRRVAFWGYTSWEVSSTFGDRLRRMRQSQSLSSSDICSRQSGIALPRSKTQLSV